MQISLLNFLFEKLPVLFEKLSEHLYLTSISTLLAIAIGIPFGLWAAGTTRLKFSVIAVANLLQTIPSLALLAFLIPFLGIGMKPAIVALAIYAILPIVKNTIIGIEGVAPGMIEAGKSLGLNRWLRLRYIEFPLAFPTIIAGIRVAAVMCVGITTIAAFIGAGGLGDFIFQGIALNDNRLVLLGAIPAGLLALVIDYGLGRFEKTAEKHPQEQKSKKKSYALLSILGIFLLFWLLIYPMFSSVSSNANTVRVATKNFTEQYILGNLIADLLEAKTNLKVEKLFNLGPTDICQRAMLKGEIDIYPEYTGTAYITVLKQPPIADANKIHQYVQTKYQKQFDITWLAPFGFNNTQTLAVRDDFAAKYHLKTISDLVPLANQLTMGAPPEFIKREDALPALQKKYHLHFLQVRSMDPGLMYRAINDKDVDVILAFSTDGRIAKYHLTLLQDNSGASPAYYAAPLIRTSVLKKHPEILTALRPLADLINDHTMQQLNYQVDVLKIPPETVAKNFLQERGLL